MDIYDSVILPETVQEVPEVCGW